MPSLRRDGITFSYLDEGDGGPPFVFQHGLGGDLSQPAGLYRSSGRLVCLECRGHGHTTPLGPSDALSFETFAGDVRALVDELGLPTFVLGGVSMGAGVALRFAAEHPERVRGLVLVRPAWLDRPSPPNLDPLVRVGEVLREHGPREGKEIFRATEDYAEMLLASPASARSLLGQFDRLNAGEHSDVLHRMPADCPLGTAPDWSALDMPALVIGNDTDPMHPLEYATAIAAALPRAEMRQVTSKTVDDAAHTREVGALIDGFIAGLEVGDGR